MIDAADIERRVAGLARLRDEDLAGLESSAPARALLDSIMVEPPGSQTTAPSRLPERGWSVRRLALAGGVVTVMTAALVLGPIVLAGGPGVATSYANSAIEVRREGNVFVARIKDPLADHAEYVEAFGAVGKDVDIELVPVPPALVGQRLSSAGGSGAVSTDVVPTGSAPVDCAVRPAACTLVIRIPAETSGKIRFIVGRAARPGEAYWHFTGPVRPPRESGRPGR